MAQSLGKLWENLKRRRFLKAGIPFIVFVVGGSFFLKQFSSIRYEFRQGRKLSKEESENMGLKLVDVRDFEKEVLEEMEKADVDNWENIRGPRPWEDSKAIQDEQRQKIPGKPSEDKR